MLSPTIQSLVRDARNHKPEALIGLLGHPKIKEVVRVRAHKMGGFRFTTNAERVSEGFARIRFFCKDRSFCPSCLGRRMNDGAAYLADCVLGATPIRHWVLTLPPPLRYLLAVPIRFVANGPVQPLCTAPMHRGELVQFVVLSRCQRHVCSPEVWRPERLFSEIPTEWQATG
jgi:hypothetical protein